MIHIARARPMVSAAILAFVAVAAAAETAWVADELAINLHTGPSNEYGSRLDQDERSVTVLVGAGVGPGAHGPRQATGGSKMIPVGGALRGIGSRR